MNAPLPQLRFTDDGRKIFQPDGDVLRAFMRDRRRVKVLRGPWGSGKTLAVINDLWQIACEQKPSPVDGLRKTRWGVIRQTYGELKNTTVKDFLDWFPPEQYGELRLSKPIEYLMRIGDVFCEVYFIALDSPEDLRKLFSTHFTGFWFHELQFASKTIFDDAEGRTGRYPPIRDGGPTWSGVLADMNEPGEDHFIPQMTGEVPMPVEMTPSERASMRWPQEWGYFVQPSALLEVFGADGKTVTGYRVNPKAENLLWLPPGFYAEKCRGKPKSWIDSRLMNRISLWVDGKPVWPHFKRETHVAKEELKPLRGQQIYVGLDFGRSPAAVFGQLANNRWQILDEIVAFDVGSTEFAPLVKRKLTERFFGYEYVIYGDPKGADKFQSGERTSYEIFDSFGMTVIPAPTPQNDIVERIEVGSFVFRSLHDGMPRVLFDPVRCRTLTAACGGKYHFEKIRGTDGQTKEIPKKDRFSNVADAFQYMLLGAGEGRVMLGKPVGHKGTPVQTRKGRRSLRRVA